MRVLLPLLCVAASSSFAAVPDDPGPGQFIATLPERYELTRLAGAWPGLYQLIRDIHEDLGTPLVSNGLFYVTPLLEAIDKQAALESIAGVTGELRNLVTLGPDGGFAYAWVYWVPGTRGLATGDVHVCHEAVGTIRGAGFITPTGEFVRTPVPQGADTCAELIAAAHR